MLRTFSTSAAAAAARPTVGFIGLGAMGMRIAENLSAAGFPLLVFDRNTQVLEHMKQGDAGVTMASSATAVSEQTDILISALPNDAVCTDVLDQLNIQAGQVHIGCSTIAPSTSRLFGERYAASSASYVSAPIFGNPEGMAAMTAQFVLSGCPIGQAKAEPILKHSCIGMFPFGQDAGTAGVVKICGNFMIAAAMESISETLTLGEQHGVDREALMSFYNSTMMDCTVYNKHGMKIASRQHDPTNGFSLNLGLKDMKLAAAAAAETNTPMPFLGVVMDEFKSSAAKGRGHLDWSAIGLNASEKAGIAIQETLAELPQAASA